MGCLMISSIQLNGQVDHAHDHHRHHHELGVANAPVYFLKEKTVSYGLHFHYVYTIDHSKFGLGLGYERIFDEHKHHTIGLVGNYRPTDELSINVSPGITFEAAESSTINFAIHFEASYEFALGNLHIGPVAEIAYDPEDIHISLGLHLGWGF